jgi:S-methylmethionine-dependent homocysteine/selenocysteine methylase
MAQYRTALPQLGGNLFLTDGGIETTLIFQDGIELPDFAAYALLGRPDGEAALQKYFRAYAGIARRFGVGLILESATWRASRDWAQRLGHTPAELADFNRAAIRQLEGVRVEFESGKTRMVISGCVGPRGDGYNPTNLMPIEGAESYHTEQVRIFADSAADMVTAITMNYVEEAIGITRAARRVGMPAVISFTVETDGRLPTGETLPAAIERVDAETAAYPAYYMINCAHPSHFERVLDERQPWAQRVRGLRANASRQSHAELKRRLQRLNVLGGCCGTDHRHIEQIATACVPLFR